MTASPTRCAVMTAPDLTKDAGKQCVSRVCCDASAQRMQLVKFEAVIHKLAKRTLWTCGQAACWQRCCRSAASLAGRPPACIRARPLWSYTGLRAPRKAQPHSNQDKCSWRVLGSCSQKGAADLQVP